MIGLLRLLLVLVVPATALAAPLQAVLVGEYQPLKTTEGERLADGFEAAWLAGLSGVLGRDIVLLDTATDAELRIGATASGPAYFSIEVAALTATDTGPSDWSELAGQPFCISEASPHATTVASRFGGVARVYPSAAQALIGLKLGECHAVVGDLLLLQQIAALPEWRRYSRLLPALEGSTLALRVEVDNAALQQQLEQAVSSGPGQQVLAQVTQQWIDEVAFQAYVLADTLDCH